MSFPIFRSFFLLTVIALIGYFLIDKQILPRQVSSAQLWQVQEGSIYDGDTLRVIRGNQELKIRFCGIDAPEKAQALGLESRDYLRCLLLFAYSVHLNTARLSPGYGLILLYYLHQFHNCILLINRPANARLWALLNVNFLEYIERHSQNQKCTRADIILRNR